MGFQVRGAECLECHCWCDSVWTSVGMICDECLVKKYTLEYALENTCGCKHSLVKELYSKKQK